MMNFMAEVLPSMALERKVMVVSWLVALIGETYNKHTLMRLAKVKLRMRIKHLKTKSIRI